MSKINEEKNYGKAYDPKLMKRLLGYAKPYWKLLLFALVLLLIITGLELLNPYLLKVAIDDKINVLDKPMFELEETSDIEGVNFDGNKYIRKDELSESQVENLEGNNLKKILKKDGNYYLVDFDKESIDSGQKLEKNEYRLFREDDLSGINTISFYFFIVILFTFIFNYIQVYILNYAGQKII